jgi:hypothetical protein
VSLREARARRQRGAEADFGFGEPAQRLECDALVEQEAGVSRPQHQGAADVVHGQVGPAARGE